MGEMKVALQLYTVREHLRDLASFTETLKRVREVGYEYVEVAGAGDVSPEDQRKVCDENGLGIIATHQSYGAFRDDLQGVIESHKVLGAQYAVISALPGELRNADGYAQVAREGSGFGAKLAEAGLGFAYHNHSFEFERVGARIGMSVLFEDSDPGVFNSELDTYWVQHGGGSPAAWIRKLSGRVPLLHVKDFEIKDGEQLFAEVGEGNLDWTSIFDAAKQAGTRWVIVEQDTCRRPSLESIAISLRNLERMGVC